jgi:hypothetical protein
MRSFIALAALPWALAAPVVNTRDSNVGTEKYIVVMKPSTGAAAEALLPHNVLKGIVPTHQYNTGLFKGFAASLNSDQVTALNSAAGVSIECSLTLVHLLTSSRLHTLRKMAYSILKALFQRDQQIS